jgi:hypothetical protein
VSGAPITGSHHAARPAATPTPAGEAPARTAGATGGRLRALLLWLPLGVAAAVVASALLAPAAFAWMQAAGIEAPPFRRLLRRIAELVAALLLLLGMRRLGVRRLGDIGLRRTPSAVRDFWLAALAAAAGSGVLLGLEFALGSRQLTGSLPPLAVARILVSAPLVGLSTQAVCSGALLFPFGQLRGAAAAAAGAMVAAFFACAHFVRGGRDPMPIDWTAGLRLWAEVPGAFIDYRESWVGLFAMGLALYLLAARQRHAWGAAGAHAGAVVAVQTAGGLGDVGPGAHTPFFVDGLLPGYGAAAVLLAWIVLVLVRTRRDRDLAGRDPLEGSAGG